MAFQIKLGIYRLEPWNDEPPRNREFHELRSSALHGALDDSPLWRVNDWGNTDDDEPHEFVEIVVALVSSPAFQAVALPALGYIGGRLAEAALEATVLEPFKEFIGRLIGRQKKKELLDFQVSLPDGTRIQVDPGDTDSRITIHTSQGSVTSVDYSATSEELPADEEESS